MNTFNFRVSNNGDSLFILIFHHNMRTGIVFENESQFLFSDEINKYSIFGILNDDFKTNEGVFEFILEYPDTEKFGHWTQSVNPLNAEPNSDVNVSIKSDSTWILNSNMPFVGLHKSNQPDHTYLEGCNTIGPNSNDEYFFAVGVISYGYDNSIPGYSRSDRFYEENLWVKVTNHLVIRKLNIFKRNTCYMQYNSRSIHILIVIFILNFHKTNHNQQI